ncbi:MAG: hypothetical protein J0M02_11605 [Planctomycetes bacterium]|nr:hypothetical protein [Planctomycetota bacterium]
MRRILIAIGIITALSGALVCWPLLRVLLTHERGHARVLDVYRQPQQDGDVALRAVWEVEVAPGRWLISDAQRNQFFRGMDDPVMDAEEADTVSQRILPDRQGTQSLVKAFWKANDPQATAFIIDVSETHPWRRYITGLAACAVGLIVARLAWAARRRQENA